MAKYEVNHQARKT